MTSSVEECGYVQKHLKRNVLTYTILIGVVGFTGAFSDMFAMLPNLALKLHAPGWVAVIPTVAATSFTHIPPFIVAWLLRPDIERRRIYAAICVPMFASILALGLTLLTVKNEATILATLLSCVILYALFNGLSIIPCYDLFARTFPEGIRGRVTGRSQVTFWTVTLIAAPIAAWFLSSRSPFHWPTNYGVVLLISTVSGIVSLVTILAFKEFKYPRTEERRPFVTYCRDLLHILHGDRAYRGTLWGALIGSALVPVSGLMLVYAKTYQGFTDDHVSMLIGFRPYVNVGASLLFAWLAVKWSPSKVCAAIASLCLVGAVSSLFLNGIWQLVPQILTGITGLIYPYILVTILAHAPTNRSQDYLSIFFLVSAIPGFAPVAQARLMDYSPALAVLSVLALSAACGVLFLGAGGKGGTREEPGVPSSG